MILIENFNTQNYILKQRLIFNGYKFTRQLQNYSTKSKKQNTFFFFIALIILFGVYYFFSK